MSRLLVFTQMFQTHVMPMHFIAIFHGCMNSIFETKTCNISVLNSLNIDCRYLLEPLQWGGSNKLRQSLFIEINKRKNVYPCKPQLSLKKLGFKRVQQQCLAQWQIRRVLCLTRNVRDSTYLTTLYVEKY